MRLFCVNSPASEVVEPELSWSRAMSAPRGGAAGAEASAWLDPEPTVKPIASQIARPGSVRNASRASERRMGRADHTGDEGDKNQAAGSCSRMYPTSAFTDVKARLPTASSG